MRDITYKLKTGNPFSLLLYWFFVYVPFIQMKVFAKNLLVWCWRYFSIGYFVPRLFSPWHRDITGYGRGFDFKRWLHVFGWNLISRGIGAFLRLIIILIGIFVEVWLIIFIIVLFFAWFLFPIIGIVLFISGLSLIF